MKLEAEYSNKGGISLLMTPMSYFEENTKILAEVIVEIDPWDFASSLHIEISDVTSVPIYHLHTINVSHIEEHHGVSDQVDIRHNNPFSRIP